MRLVLDTNIWLDWLVFADPGIAPLQATVAAGRADIAINTACEDELIRVLGYPLQHWTLDATRQGTCLEQCRRIALRMDAPCTTTLPQCADPDDQKFLELAASAQADCLITKDRALLALAKHRPSPPLHTPSFRTLSFRIMTPAEFSQLP